MNGRLNSWIEEAIAEADRLRSGFEENSDTQNDAAYEEGRGSALRMVLNKLAELSPPSHRAISASAAS